MRQKTAFRFARIALLLSLLLLVVPAVSAHRPLWVDSEAEVIEVPNLTTSFATYRDLETVSQVDIYSFEAQSGQELYAGINIPAVRGLESYAVNMAIVGPGLPLDQLSTLPVDYPEGAGTLIVPSVVSQDFYEPFTQTNYWGRQRVETNLPQAGTYYLLVWNPQGEKGKYVLDIGRAEIFGPTDMFRFPIWWVRVHHFFGHTPYLVAAALFMLALIAALVIRKRRLQLPVVGQPLQPPMAA